MADIDQIIAGGAGASSRANFSGFDGLLDAFYKGRDQKYQQEGRDLFKGGIPTTADGQPDFAAMGKALFQHGDVGQGVSLSNLDLQRQQLKAGQDVAAKMGQAEGGAPPTDQSSPPIVGPSTSRNSVTIDPSKRADISAPTASQQQATVMTVLAAQGIPNDQLGAASASIARQLGVDPTAPINLQDPQIRNVLAPAIQQLKKMGIGQVVPQGQPSPPPQVIPPQGQPNPQLNPQMDQRTFGAPPATPTRGSVPVGNDPEIQKQIATYTYIASNPAYPKPVQEAALTRLKALQEQGAPTGPMKEYDLYRRQGGDMSFKDFAADMESGKAGATERAKAEVKEQQDYISQGRMAQQRLGTLNTISNIVSSDKNLDLGFGSETTLKIKMALEKAGMDFGDLSGSQLIQKLNGVLASESSKSFSTRPTQFEFKTFLANNPGLALDEKGNVRMLGILSQTAKREADLGKLARQNQDNWAKWDDVVEKYDQDHPIKDPTTGKVLSNHSIIAPAEKTDKPASPRQFASPDAVHSAIANGQLKKGDTFLDNNGKTRVVP
jgi:hypothetical protein